MDAQTPLRAILATGETTKDTKGPRRRLLAQRIVFVLLVFFVANGLAGFPRLVHPSPQLQPSTSTGAAPPP
jgi:hypothetical protein